MEYKRLKEKLEDILTLPELPFEEDLTAVDCKQMYDILCKIEQGTLIELPCKVGDTVYCVYASTGIQEWEVRDIEILKNTILFLLEHTGTEDYNAALLSEVGKYFFFTREEAEKRLKELTEGGGQ